MKPIRLFAILIALTCVAFGQGIRFGDGQPVWTTISAGSNPALGVIPNAVINFCNFPANGTPCTNKATTYTDQTLSVSCSSSTQIVLAGTTSCVGTADALGNWGVWIAPGQYAYTITASGTSSGPYFVSIGLQPKNGGDNTKQVKVDVSGATTSTAVTEIYAQTANRNYTWPDAAITVTGAVFQDCGSTSGATQNCANTVKPVWFSVRGDVLLNSAATQAVGSLPFTSSSSYSCVCSDLTSAAGICNFTTYTSGASATIQESSGSTTDHLRYQCSGF